MVEDLFQRAMTAFKAKRKDEARGLFMDVVEQDAQHEQAWLYLSALVETLEEQQICLENVLTINPDNAKAQQGLATLQKKLSGQQKTTPPPSSESDTWASFAEPSSPVAESGFVSPFGDASPLGADFSVQDDDNLFGAPTFGQPETDSPPAFGSGFDFTPDDSPDTSQEADDPFSWLNDMPEQPSVPDSPPAASPPPAADSSQFNFSASSVDWGSDDQPATYGSGRHIDEPTADEYDSWMDNLPLGEDTTAIDDSDDVSSAFGATPFGDTSFMVEDDSYVDDELFGRDISGAQTNDAFWDPSYDAGAASSDDSLDAFGTQDARYRSSPRSTSESVSDDFFDAAGGFAEDDSDRFGGSIFDAEDDDSRSAIFDEPEPASAGGGFDFSFDDEDDSDAAAALEARLNAVASSPATSKPATPKAAVPSVDYYSLIPPEIAPSEGGVSPRTKLLVGGIAIMIVLNIASFLLLAM